MLQSIYDRLRDYDANNFIDELTKASKGLGILEEKINNYQFNQLLIPMLHKKEAISSMKIEGTQITISNVFENELQSNNTNDKTMIEVMNHISVLNYGATYLHSSNFSHGFIKKLHAKLLNGLVSTDLQSTLGEYKKSDNRIVNSLGVVVFLPPSYTETKKFMDELILFMNDINDGINPLIKAALIHSQFESIHPFADGNGRIGRLLISLFLYKSGVINFPFFYLSEAISMDKHVYYNMLTDSRINNYDGWIKYFLQKIIIQTNRHIEYINSLNKLYLVTKNSLQRHINSSKIDEIVECLFTRPIITADYMIEKMLISRVQALRYLNILVESNILFADDRKRRKKYYFAELIDLTR